MDKTGSGVVTSAAMEVGMTLEEVEAAEAEARRLQTEPLVRIDIRMRKCERLMLETYSRDKDFESISEAARTLIRGGLIRWEREKGGEHGGL